jgi:hypothetical protein
LGKSGGTPIRRNPSTNPLDDPDDRRTAMTEPQHEDPLEVPALLDPEDAGLPNANRRGHGKMPDLDDDQLALIAARERVAAGVQDYVPEDVPPATDPLPEGSSEEADLAQRGLVEEVPVDDDEA